MEQWGWITAEIVIKSNSSTVFVMGSHKNNYLQLINLGSDYSD